MNKKMTIIALSVIALVGSIITFVGSNFFFADILNKDGDMFATMFATFPMVCFGIILIGAFLYFTRLYLRPKTFGRMTKTYLIVGLSTSGVGFLTAILSGLVVYGSFIKPNPFPGYLIIFMILHAALIAGGVVGLVKIKGIQDEEHFQMSAGHVFKTIGWFLFIALVFNRFGALLLSPMYIHWRTLYMTFPFYIYLLYPMCLGVLKMLTLLDVIPQKLRIPLSIASLAINTVLFAVIAIIAINDTAMISAVSPAMPLERLSSMPLEIIIHFGSFTAVSIILWVQAAKAQKANNVVDIS